MTTDRLDAKSRRVRAPARAGLRSLVRELAPFTAFLVWLWLEIPAQANAEPAVRVPALLIAAAYSVSFLAALIVGPRLRPASRVVVVAGLFALGLALPVLFRRPELLTLTAYAIAASVVLLPLRAAKWLGPGTAALLFGATTIARGSPDVSDTVLVGLLSLGLVSATQLSRTVAELRAARDQVRTLAVSEERGRVARDLHDLLGHSLTTITLKTGVARRLLESGRNAERALGEVREVEVLSRQALAEVRATVSDFRRTSLAAELAGVRGALETAGIRLTAPHAVDDVAVHLQQPFAFVIREATTNVIRHSGAGHCEIRLGETWVEITDDGTGSTAAPGNGLSGLADRLAGVDGRLTTGPASGGGFRVRAEVAGST
ncbi:histidine kinase [Amycolatopsis rhabdoformis]|uniref:Histidine kinase n=1 Tax=Amycolatopsis rhabdoformis TaxID=1448059 RepID=A0ABZ1IDH4_9PSEU|nr:histidine kinase [Amycolatopsis rhabdoformis]WSE31967.1 histidine kinase [Amycolatopsis rhabdoformis]